MLNLELGLTLLTYNIATISFSPFTNLGVEARAVSGSVWTHPPNAVTGEEEEHLSHHHHHSSPEENFHSSFHLHLLSTSTSTTPTTTF
ncbi:hypothetical protein MTR_1g059620 [Medicago truncatula]|uniref:Uncharacterized protein n=1 Tax=Medicago truncatula TaxID=3880 RepID=A0A072VK47_MEDTR|nr:hypothetical protein MTR_1g059620 [Medicago truncatula]